MQIVPEVAYNKKLGAANLRGGIFPMSEALYPDPILCVLVGLVVLLAISWLTASFLRPANKSMATPPEEHHVEREDGSTQLASEGKWTVVGPAGKPMRTHPLYKRVAALNGEVNMLSIVEVKERLREMDLSCRGIHQVLIKRLKHRLRRDAVRSDPSAPWDLRSQTESNPYGLDYLCVLDFEATCEVENPPDYVHEIIEFPVLLLNLKTLQVEAEFHHYCRPWLNPVLSEFCKRLTGIRQDQVNRAPYFMEVFRMFTEWLESKGLTTTHKFAVVTDCPWDIRECLFPQCVLAQVPFPKYATKWIDARKLFASFYQMRSGNLAKMLEYLGMRFEGREHCGLHDTRNIQRVLVQMIRDGCVLKYNRFMPEDALSDFAKR